MSEFAAFILIIFTAVWGSIALWWGMFGRHNKLGDGGADNDLMLQAVREELDAMSMRLMRVEDDLAFYNELHAPDNKKALPGADAPESDPIDPEVPA